MARFALLPQHSTGGTDENPVRITGDPPEMQSGRLPDRHVTQTRERCIQLVLEG